jgi:hypothetical protein
VLIRTCVTTVTTSRLIPCARNALWSTCWIM